VEGRAPPDPATVRSIIAGIMLAMFLSALEQTIVAPALPTIGARLGDIDELSWVAGAYLLGATAATPLFGKLSDIYGRRAILLTGVSIFIAGSVACALAPKMGALIAARALQGIGGGSILPISQAIVATWCRRASGRAIRPSRRRYSWARASPARSSAASSPTACTGRSSSGSTCRWGRSRSSCATGRSRGCPATSVRTGSTGRAPP
jgi:MFS family permease